MRKNKYIYVVELDDKHQVLFNGLNRDFLIIANRAVSSFLELLNFPYKYLNSHPSIIENLKSRGFIIEDDFDERALLKHKREEFIWAKEYKTTILPTFECNYNCWYCIQKHEPVVIDKSKINLIVKHVKKYLVENHIESYILSWFGGEPLTQPEIIDYVSRDLKQFCQSHKIEYSGAVTTNGALLSMSTIEMLKENGIDFYQIAIDGDEHAHNHNKKDEHAASSFALILTNIVNLLRHNQKADVVLRLNYTIATLKSKNLINDINKYIPTSYRSRIVVDLQKVWQVNEKNVPMSLLVNLQKALVASGFTLSTEHVFSMCYVEKEHYNMFYYNGGVEKCDKRPIEKLRGHLDEEGNIVWNEKPMFADYDLFDERCICNNCLYYPLCYCGCPIEREDVIRENHGKIICSHKGKYGLLMLRIQDYCWRVINNKKIRLE